MVKRLGALAVLAACTGLLGGCVSIQAISSDQQEIVGKLRLTLTICASGQDDGVEPGGPLEDHPGCGVENAAYYGVDGSEYQLLFAIRVPNGTGTPETIFATPTPAPPASGTITARRNASYETALQTLRPAAAGSRWVGYVSDPYAFDNGADDVPAQTAQVAVDLALPPSADGGPFVGPLAVRPVAGARLVDSANELPASRAVQCGDDPTVTYIAEFTICIDAPNTAQVGTNFNFPTRDFGIVGGNATASPGQTVSLPFNVRGAGALPAGLSAALTAGTTLPGATAAPSTPSTALANGSDTRVTVPVAIPKTAGPGVFDVTLTGRLDNGQTRSTTAKLTVRDRQKPVVSKLAVKPKSFKAATKRKPKRRTNVSYTLSEAASVRVVVERCSKYAKLKKKAKKSAKSVKPKRGRCLRYAAMSGATAQTGKAGANGFRFNGKVAGKALKPGPYRLVLTATDGAANVGDKVRAAFTIRR